MEGENNSVNRSVLEFRTERVNLTMVTCIYLLQDLFMRLRMPSPMQSPIHGVEGVIMC